MSENPSPSEATDSTIAEEVPTVRRLPAVLVVCLLVAVPVAYLALHKSAAQPVATAVVTKPADISSLEAAVQANPNAGTRISLALAYIRGGRSASAVPLLQTTLATEPGNATAWNDLCVAHIMLQDYASAMTECTHATQVDATFQLAKNNLKWAQDENAKALASIASMEQVPAGERDPKQDFAEGFLYLHVGNYESAISAWQRVVARDPHNALAMNNVGTAYMLLKQPRQALTWFQKASALDPSLQVAQNNIAWARAEIAKAN